MVVIIGEVICHREAAEQPGSFLQNPVKLGMLVLTVGCLVRFPHHQLDDNNHLPLLFLAKELARPCWEVPPFFVRFENLVLSSKVLHCDYMYKGIDRAS